VADTARNERPQCRSGPGQPAGERAGTAPDYAGLTGEPAAGGLPAVLGRLRNAAAAHDDELTSPGSLAPPG
jgi:hypothetical protein